MVESDAGMADSDSDDDGPGNSGSHRPKGARDISQEMAKWIHSGSKAKITNRQLAEQFKCSLTSVKKVNRLKGTLVSKTRGRPRKRTEAAVNRIRAVGEIMVIGFQILSQTRSLGQRTRSLGFYGSFYAMGTRGVHTGGAITLLNFFKFYF